MGEKNYKDYHERAVIENHATAAWANSSGGQKELSGVYIPNEQEVINAKEFVDENEK